MIKKVKSIKEIEANSHERLSVEQKNKDIASLYLARFKFISQGVGRGKKMWICMSNNVWKDNAIQFLQLKMGLQLTPTRKANVVDLLMAETYMEDPKFDCNPNIVPVDGSILDYSNSEMKVRKITSEDMITHTLPVKYDPSAVSKIIAPFLEKTVTDPTDLWNLYAMIGYSFIKSSPYKAIFHILGETNTGKSTFLEILRKLFGDLVSSVSVYDMDKDQYIEKLRGMMINIEDEGSGDILSPKVIAKLKQLSGSEIAMLGKQMYVNPKNIETKPKIIMASNNWPSAKLYDAAYSKRCVKIYFNHEFDLTNKDRVVAEMTSDYELSALLNIALKHLDDLNKRGSFKPSYLPQEIEADKDVLKENTEMLKTYKKKRMNEIAKEIEIHAT